MYLSLGLQLGKYTFSSLDNLFFTSESTVITKRSSMFERKSVMLVHLTSSYPAERS